MVDGVASGGTGLTDGATGKGDVNGDDFNKAIDQAKAEKEGLPLMNMVAKILAR